MPDFNRKDKCLCFFFLPDDLSAALSSICIGGISVGIHFLNLLAYEEISSAIKPISLLLLIILWISIITFIVGIYMKKLILIQQEETILAMFLFFSLACFCCNFSTLISSYSFKDEYNLIYVYTGYYAAEHPDTELDEEGIINYIKKKFYLESFAHIVLLGIMIYHFFVNNSYIKKYERKINGDYEDLIKNVNSSSYKQSQSNQYSYSKDTYSSGSNL